MKIKKKKIIGIIIIILGLIILLYPIAINKVTTTMMSKVINKFEVDANNNIKKNNALYEEFEEYNKDLYKNGQKLVDAFSYENASFDLTKYGYNENIVGYIEIPKMNVNLPIYLGASKENLLKGATLLSQTSIPIGGENTNSVIAAHRGLIRNAMFRNIEKLEIGDEIIITNSWEKIKYKVCDIKVILPDNVDAILIQEGKDLVSLITCHPYRGNYERYVVYAERV